MSISNANSSTGTAIVGSLVDAKGDLLVGTADNVIDRFAVGSTLQTLIPDSTQTAGVRWGDDLLVLQLMQVI